MIVLLKSRGTKGRLSKMTKPQLKALLEKTTPPTSKELYANSASDRACRVACWKYNLFLAQFFKLETVAVPPPSTSS
jgi:hypothetical protein